MAIQPLAILPTFHGISHLETKPQQSPDSLTLGGLVVQCLSPGVDAGEQLDIAIPAAHVEIALVLVHVFTIGVDKG